MSVKAMIRLLCPAQSARPGPAIGQALGPHGLNMAEFCKNFNAATQKIPEGTPVPVVLTAYTNRTYSFVTKTPPTSYLIKKELGIEKGAKSPGHEMIGQLTIDQVHTIAKIKHEDKHLQHIPFDAICKSIIGSAASMGVSVDQTSSTAEGGSEAVEP